MKGFIHAAFLGSLYLMAPASAFCEILPQQSIVAEYVDESISVISERGNYLKFQKIQLPEAGFVKLHFSDFRPPPGVAIEVRNESGSESYLYSRDHMDAHTFDLEAGDDGVTSFSAMSISGDTVVIEVHGKPGQSKGFEKSFAKRVLIDYLVRGLSPGEAANKQDNATSKNGRLTVQSNSSNGGSLESTCGADERFDSVCWADSHPAAFDRSRPVAKLVTGLKSCTAWRVGSDDLMFTNNHCMTSQNEASATEIWFNYQSSTCDGPADGAVVKVSADKLISTDYTLDYSLFKVSDASAISSFGNFGLEVRDAVLTEEIYIPQHGSGDPKQLAILSDMNLDGLCQVDDEDHFGRADGTDIGYLCDTIGGSSGAPVVASESHRAIALHHSGGCMNSGVKMSLIWPKVARHFGRDVPQGDYDGTLPDPNPEPPVDQEPVASFGFVCNGLDCSFDGSGSSDSEGDITSWSWDFGDGATASGVSPGHVYAQAGSYSVSLTVSDSAGQLDGSVKSVTVADPVANQAPEAAFSFNCTGDICSFDASSSIDVDGSIVSYDWDFGDGSIGNGVSLNHVFVNGTFPVTLTVTDNLGASDSLSRSVQVSVAVESGLELSGTGVKSKGRKLARLSWSGSESSHIEIFRDGVKLAVAENAGQYTDASLAKKTRQAIYQVCETTGGSCSNELLITF